MKKILSYSFIFLGFFIFSCKKERSPGAQNTTSPKKYPVTLTVSDFTQIIGNSTRQLNSLGTDAISAFSKILYYKVYNASGLVVHSLIQVSTDSNFGTLQDTLAAGTYKVVIAAGQTGLSDGFLQESSKFSTAIFTYNTFGDTNEPYINQPWKDTFFKTLPLTITSGAINQSVALDRIVSKIQVQILDTIPANAYSVQLIYTNEYSTYSDSLNKAITSAFVETSAALIPAAAKGKVNYVQSNIIGNTAAPLNVTIKCFDASHNVIAQAAVTGVTCQKNVVTVLSGKLFAVNNAFIVSLNTTWDPTPITIHY